MNASPRTPQASAGQRPNEAKRPKCPLCGKPASGAYRPFCGKRCADVDLYRWLDGRYAVPGEPVRTEPENDPGDD